MQSHKEISRLLAAMYGSNFSHLQVDVHQPDVTLEIEIRREGAYLYSRTIPCWADFQRVYQGRVSFCFRRN